MHAFARRYRKTSTTIKAAVLAVVVVVSMVTVGAQAQAAAAAVTPSFKQGNAAEVNSGTANSVAFPGANAAGDLIVVYVVWGNGGAVTISDTRGNAYASTEAAKAWGNGWSAQVFYAKNVTAGTNTVNAVFARSLSGNFGIVYVHEYTGIDRTSPLDVSKSATGTASAMSSGAATTTNATDLIFGAGASSITVTQPGAGFVSRSTASGNRTEDKVVTAAGSYAATATQNGNAWVMHMVAFKADPGSPDTTPPSVPTGLTATANSPSQINLTWTASTDNVGVAGYKVFRNGAQVGTVANPSYSDTGLTQNTTYNYAVSAFDAAGNASAPSATVSASTPLPDTTPPSASMTAPANGATVSGTVSVSANAADDVEVASVEFLLDGVTIGTDTTVPYSVQWNTSTTSNGAHSLSARASDTSGNFGITSGVVHVTVNNTAPPPPPGLVAGWNFDEGQGAGASDASGNGNVALFQNSVQWTAGKYGSGVRLAGGYLTVANSPTVNVSGTGFTLSAWINPASSSGDELLLAKFWTTSMTAPFYQYGLELQNNGTVPHFFVGTSGGVKETSMGSAVPIGVWSHLAVTFDGSTARYYLNGNLVASPAMSAALSARTSVMNVGADLGPGQYFSGSLDDLRLYGRAESQAEVQTDMTTPLTARTSGGSGPTVSITSPANGAQVSGTITATAVADADLGVAGVQFYLDGSALGPEDTVVPYGADWDTRGATNGAHTLTARARDTAGNITVAQPVNVNVVNTNFFQNEILATGLALPTAMKFLPDQRMLVAELKGRIRVLPAPYTTPDPTPFLQLTNVGSNPVQQGIYDFALDPNFASNHFYYVFYTAGSPNVDRLSRFTASADNSTTNLATEKVLYQDPNIADAEHHGGGIAFAPDGKIFFTTGDHFQGTPAQDLTSPRGKIHRINPDGTAPTDNPYYDGSGPNWDSVWAIGLRNPWRAFYDTATNRLLVSDVGGNVASTSIEELNVGARGANYGWPDHEGSCSAPCTSPIYSYPHNGRDAAITGGFVYHGTQFPASMQGSYFFGDYAQNWIKRLTFDANGNVSGVVNFEPADGTPDGPTGDVVYLTEGPDGALYYLDLGYSDTTGTSGISKVRRIRYLQSNQAPIAMAAANPTSGTPPLTVSFSSAGSVDPEGQPVTMSWDFGDNTVSTTSNPSHTYTQPGKYTVRLTVSDGVNSTFSTPITISVGNAPVPTITAPVDGATFRAGDVISYSGAATDVEDGDLPASAFSWTIDFLHDGHVHPGQTVTGVKSGTFTIPTTGHDFSGLTRYRITLTATDSTGLTGTTTVLIWPQKVNLTFDTVPTGLTLYLDGIAHTTPFVYDTLIGFNHTIEARNQTSGNTNYTFASWSDGRAQQHTVVVPAADASYTATYTATAANTGLVAAWGFNESSGTTATDSSGNNNSATLVNGPVRGTGKYGGGLSLDGINDYLSVPNSSSLDISGTGLTLSAWLNPVQVSGDSIMLGKFWNTGMTSPFYQYGIELDGGVTPHFYIGTSSGLRGAGMGAPLPLAQWSHLAITFDGSQVRFYVNGALVTSSPLIATITARGNGIRVGADATTQQFYKGMIDDVRVYSLAQTAAEIQADMNNPTL